MLLGRPQTSEWHPKSYLHLVKAQKLRLFKYLKSGKMAGAVAKMPAISVFVEIFRRRESPARWAFKLNTDFNILNFNGRRTK